MSIRKKIFEPIDHPVEVRHAFPRYRTGDLQGEPIIEYERHFGTLGLVRLETQPLPNEPQRRRLVLLINDRPMFSVEESPPSLDNDEHEIELEMVEDSCNKCGARYLSNHGHTCD